MIHQFLDFLRSLTNPEQLIQLLSTVFTGWWGYLLLFSIVFSETGLLAGFFLPGDSLLFTVGVVAGAGQLNIVTIIVTLICAALTGQLLRLLSRTLHWRPALRQPKLPRVPSRVSRADSGLLREARR